MAIFLKFLAIFSRFLAIFLEKMAIFYCYSILTRRILNTNEAVIQYEQGHYQMQTRLSFDTFKAVKQ